MDNISSRFALFLGAESESVTFDFVSEPTLYISFSVENKDDDTVDSVLEEIKGGIEKAQSLVEIESAVDGGLSNLEEGPFSFAAAAIRGDIIYLVTRGDGVVFVRRADAFKRLISDKQSASGHIKENDLFILMSSNLEKELIQQPTQSPDPQVMVDDLKKSIQKNTEKMIGLFIAFEKAKSVVPSAVSQDGIEQNESALPGVVQSPSIRDKFVNLSNLLVSQSSSRSKKVTFLITFILFIVLVWSVGFGYTRREAANRAKKIAETKTSIDTKLSEAQDLSSLNVDRSQELFNEAKQEVSALKAEIGTHHEEEIAPLEELLNKKEQEIFKTANANSEIFYDLSLIAKNARARSMALTGDSLALINSETGEVYSLSVSKKSASTIQNRDLRGADRVGVYEDNVFVLSKTGGIFKIEDKKVSRIIEKDDKWTNPIDIALFNGNIYVLDSGADEVYKYLVAEEGYSGLQSYFKGGQVDLAKASAFAIDSSVYISQGQKIYKYTSGLRETFDISIPDKEGADFSDIFVNKETNAVYILDKVKGKVYVVSKTGEYQKQIESNIFKSALDFVVVEKNDDPKKTGILVLTETKIFRVPIE